MKMDDEELDRMVEDGKEMCRRYGYPETLEGITDLNKKFDEMLAED